MRWLAGLLHHTVCFTSLHNTLAVLKGYMRLLQQWQLQRAAAGLGAVVLWRTAESFGDFKDHVFAMSNGSTLVMRGRCAAFTLHPTCPLPNHRGRPTHLNPRCTRRRIEIANQWSRDLAEEHGLRLMDAAQVVVWMLLVTPHTSHLTPQTSHLTPHTSHLTPHTSHLTPHSSHHTPHLIRHRF
jgi:hypothetical protein